MGNSSGKESREPTRPSGLRPPTSPGSVPSAQSSPTFPFDRPTFIRGPGGGLLAIGGGSADSDSQTPEVRKETKQEREARKLEKERAARLKERDRSLREEGVDGGYLVTLGTYVGPEDFSKSIVRQLQIERRLAPFWRGLNEHSSSWTEHQLVAAARDLPIPAADEIPPEFASPDLDADTQNKGNTAPAGSSSIPIRQAPKRLQTDTLSSSQPTPFNQSDSPISPPSGPSPLFRGRAKTLASLTSSKNSSQVDITPQEIHLPKEPQINGQPVEAYLYKDAAECPICFLYYPPYLNKTRCCDQPICSECFVQIKRPDPHPPEHSDPNEPLPAEPKPAEEEGQLISEPSQCPFCVQPEFGVTYEPPPFRRGLAYANQGTQSSFGRIASAMSSSSSLSTSNPGNASPVTRRRTHSLSATAPAVITTDRVRPDWAKKLSDARAHAARRSAAATALHTAAYMMPSGYGGFHLGRRRRQNLSLDSAQQQGSGDRDRGGYLGNMDFLFAALEGQGSSRRPPQGNNDLFPGRVSSRGTRADDLEEMMMMEAIRQSLAAEEERKKKEEKETSKQSKKDEKKQAKEQKKADKEAKKTGSYSAETPGDSFYANAEPSTSNVEISVEDGKGKGRATGPNPAQNRAAYIGFDPLSEPTSTLNTETSTSSREDPQRHLEDRRTQLDQGLQQSGSSYARPRGISDASSSGSSYIESSNASGSHLPQDGSTGDSGLNFGSLAAMVDEDDETVVHEQNGSAKQATADSGAISGMKESTPLAQTESNPYDQKHYGDITLLEGPSERQTTQ